MTYNQEKTLEVLETYLLLKVRIELDKARNDVFQRLFKFLDRTSKRLDTVVDKRVKKFNMAQYAMLRDITEGVYSPSKSALVGRLFPEQSPKVKVTDSRKAKKVESDYDDEDFWPQTLRKGTCDAE